METRPGKGVPSREGSPVPGRESRPGKGVSIEEVSNHQETLALEVFPPNCEEKLNKAHRLRA